MNECNDLGVVVEFWLVPDVFEKWRNTSVESHWLDELSKNKQTVFICTWQKRTLPAIDTCRVSREIRSTSFLPVTCISSGCMSRERYHLRMARYNSWPPSVDHRPTSRLVLGRYRCINKQNWLKNKMEDCREHVLFVACVIKSVY